MLPSFEYYKPDTLQEAVELLKKHGNDAVLIAGGTDVLVQLRNKKIKPKYLVSIAKIGELNSIKEEKDRVVVGAGVTHRMVEKSALINRCFPILVDGSSQVGSVQIRNVATVVGNICNSMPSADTAPPLLALNASVKIFGADGEKEVKLDKFFTGPGKNILKTGEVVTEIIIPKDVENSGGAYLKFGRRKAMDLSLLGVAVFMNCDMTQKKCNYCRIALGTAAPVPMRTYEAEKFLKGKNLTEEVFTEAGKIAAQEARPRSSWRADAGYRRELIQTLLKRTAFKALERASLK